MLGVTNCSHPLSLSFQIFGSKFPSGSYMFFAVEHFPNSAVSVLSVISVPQEQQRERFGISIDSFSGTAAVDSFSGIEAVDSFSITALSDPVSVVG